MRRSLHTPSEPLRAAGRARPLRWLTAPVIAAVVLTGCSVPSNNPAGYDDDVESFFVQGCTGDVPETDGTTTTLAAAGDCSPCAYQVFTDLVPYDDTARETEQYQGYPAEAPTFSGLESDLGSDPDALDQLPDEVRSALADCVGDGSGGGGELLTTTTTQG